MHQLSRELIAHAFERCGPLLERLNATGFPDTKEMLIEVRRILDAMPEPDRVAVINAHPRIGETPAVVKAQSATAFREQGYDRDPEAPAVMAELARLNAEYERKFGFRFVVFVNRRRKADLVPVMHARMERTREQEMETALGEILAIAADRLAHA